MTPPSPPSHCLRLHLLRCCPGALSGFRDRGLLEVDARLDKPGCRVQGSQVAWTCPDWMGTMFNSEAAMSSATMIQRHCAWHALNIDHVVWRLSNLQQHSLRKRTGHFTSEYSETEIKLCRGVTNARGSVRHAPGSSEGSIAARSPRCPPDSKSLPIQRYCLGPTLFSQCE